MDGSNYGEVPIGVVLPRDVHLRYSKPILWLLAGAGFFWLGIILVLALSESLTRGWQ